MFIRRTQPTMRHLEARIALFGAGAILAMVGIWAQQGWLINVAIAVLLIGFMLFIAFFDAGDWIRAGRQDREQVQPVVFAPKQ